MKSLISQLSAILQLKAGTRFNGKVASERTKTAIGDSLRASFRHLVNLNFRLQNPENLGDKHVKALCEFWYQSGLTPKTIQSNLSYLRIFARWIGKGEIVKQRAKLSRFGVETASNSFHLSM